MIVYTCVCFCVLGLLYRSVRIPICVTVCLCSRLSVCVCPMNATSIHPLVPQSVPASVCTSLPCSFFPSVLPFLHSRLFLAVAPCHDTIDISLLSISADEPTARRSLVQEHTERQAIHSDSTLILCRPARHNSLAAAASPSSARCPAVLASSAAKRPRAEADDAAKATRANGIELEMPMPVRHPLEPDRTAFVRSPALATRCGEQEQNRACALTTRSSGTKNDDDAHISSHDVTNGRWCISKFGSQRRDVTAAGNDAARTRSLVVTSRFDIPRGERV